MIRRDPRVHTLPRVQKKVYLFISEFTEAYGYPPTTVEVAEGLGMPEVRAASSAVNALRQKGAVTNKHNRQRSVYCCWDRIATRISVIGAKVLQQSGKRDRILIYTHMMHPDGHNEDSDTGAVLRIETPEGDGVRWVYGQLKCEPSVIMLPDDYVELGHGETGQFTVFDFDLDED